MVTPLGLGQEASWQRLIAGDRAGQLLTSSQIDHAEALAELLQRPPGGAAVDHDEVRRHIETVCDGDTASRFGHDELNNLVLASAAEAWAQAGLNPDSVEPHRLGCVIGTSKASLRAMERWSARSPAERQSRRDEFQNSFLPDAPLRAVASLFRSGGPVGCPVAACATGLIAVLQAARLIASGECDVCLAGSGDASLRASVLASFHRLGVTSRHADPQQACRPFDRHRDGFMIGEGAAVFVLESRAHARRRRAPILASVAAGAWGTDFTGITQIDAAGTAVRQVLGRLSNQSPVPLAPDFVSVHGTATETNDLAESRGLASSLAGAVPCFGTKGSTGHLLGAAGSVELAFAILALRDGRIPGTSNLRQTDPDCPIDVVDHPRQVEARTALKLSLGFGGHVAACLLQKGD